MNVTRVATLDGTWELRPVLVLALAEDDDDGRDTVGYTLSYLDVIKLVDMIDEEPGIEAEGFMIKTGRPDGPKVNATIVEFPPGEPSANAVAALRWYAAAIGNAGPMPATDG